MTTPMFPAAHLTVAIAVARCDDAEVVLRWLTQNGTKGQWVVWLVDCLIEALCEAAELGDEPRVLEVLDFCESLGSTQFADAVCSAGSRALNRSGVTPLELATAAGHTSVMQLLSSIYELDRCAKQVFSTNILAEPATKLAYAEEPHDLKSGTTDVWGSALKQAVYPGERLFKSACTEDLFKSSSSRAAIQELCKSVASGKEELCKSAATEAPCRSSFAHAMKFPAVVDTLMIDKLFGPECGTILKMVTSSW